MVHYIALQAVHYKPLQEVHLSRYNHFLSANKVVSVEVEIENLTTGDYASYYDQISTTTLLLPLSGTGYYRISVTLSDGVNFYGEFDL